MNVKRIVTIVKLIMSVSVVVDLYSYFDYL